MKNYKFILYVVVLLGVLAAMLISVIEWRAYDLSFYEETYEELNTYEYIGMSKEDLMKTTDVLLSYMQRKREDMVVMARIHGIEREVFNEREKLHMLDVNALIQKAEYFMYGAYTLLGALIVYLLYKRSKEELYTLSKAGLWSVGIFFGIILLLVGFIVIDFDAFWTMFHHVFFTNDLWLLNPYTDVMIQMFPLEFFNKMVVQIALSYVLFLFAFCGLCIVGVRQKKKVIA